MKLVSEKQPDLQALYGKQLRVVLSAEELILRGLPRMAEMATDGDLVRAFRSHVLETEAHVSRLQGILAKFPGESDPVKSKVVEALIAEAEDMMEDADHDSVRDAALIAAAQRIEHYEIAAYGALRHFAHVLGRHDDAQVLSQTMVEEGHADRLLSNIATRVNPAARIAA